MGNEKTAYEKLEEAKERITKLSMKVNLSVPMILSYAGATSVTASIFGGSDKVKREEFTEAIFSVNEQMNNIVGEFLKIHEIQSELVDELEHVYEVLESFDTVYKENAVSISEQWYNLLDARLTALEEGRRKDYTISK